MYWWIDILRTLNKYYCLYVGHVMLSDVNIAANTLTLLYQNILSDIHIV